MKAPIEFHANYKTAEEFRRAVELTGTPQEDVDRYFETCLLTYLRDLYAKRLRQTEELLSRSENEPGGKETYLSHGTTLITRNRRPQSVENHTAKKIQRWANKPDCVPHKIIQAFLELGGEQRPVPKKALAERVAELTGDEKKFARNYPQMKISLETHGNAHGLIFTESNDLVELHENVKDVILALKEEFINQ